MLFGWRKNKIPKILTQDLRDASGPAVIPSTIPWSFIRNGLHDCQETIVKLLKWGEPFLCGMPNDSKTGLKTNSSCSYKAINTPQSLVYNIIEAVGHLDGTKRQPTSKKELWNALQEAIPEVWLQTPRESLSKRDQTVLKNKGGQIHLLTFNFIRIMILYFHFNLYMFYDALASSFSSNT